MRCVKFGFPIQPAGALFLCMAVSIAACSSLHKRAEELYEGNAYEEAANVYEEILRSDPEDAKAIVGLKKSREKLVDTKLIEVRHSRMAGNELNSIDMLLHLVEQENQWAFYPTGPVAFTQEEEGREALTYLRKSTRVSLKRNYPLKAYEEVNKYNSIFKGVLLPQYEALIENIRDAGKKQCGRFAAATKPGQPYFSEFTHKLCAFWGTELRNVADEKSSKFSELFSKVVFGSHLSGLPDDVATIFQEAVENSIRQTPWYDSGGALTANVHLKVKFTRKDSSKEESRVHEYTIQVPYTAYVPTLKTRQVPYTTYQYQCSYNYYTGNSCSNVPVTQYRTDFYTENEPVTRYRTVPKAQPYDGVALYRLMLFFGDGEISIAKNRIKFSLSNKLEESGFEHNWNLPDIGLLPQKANLTDPLEWVRKQAEAFGTNAADQANSLWENQYCKPVGKESSLTISGERVHRCIRARSVEPPRFVSQWYEEHLGVTYSEANAALNLSGTANNTTTKEKKADSDPTRDNSSELSGRKAGKTWLDGCYNNDAWKENGFSSYDECMDAYRNQSKKR